MIFLVWIDKKRKLTHIAGWFGPKTKIRNTESGLNKIALPSICFLCVCFLPFQVTPGWRVRHTARRPVQHLPRARWRCRRRQEQQKSARAICCEQVSANCLRELRQRRARASATWVETNIFIYPRFVEGAHFQALKHNRPCLEQEEKRWAGAGSPTSVPLSERKSYRWQNPLDNHNHA